MAHIRPNQWEPTKKQEELLARINSPETLKGINEIIAEAARPYVPGGKDGDLATDYTARKDGILYNKPYARYQYYGKVMGKNYAKVIGGHFVFSSQAAPKHLNGHIIGDGTSFQIKDRASGTIHTYTRHYTKDNTGAFWIWEMWQHERRRVQNKITWYLKGLDK